MNLQHRVDLLEKLGKYILLNDEEWRSVQHRASVENSWFIPEFIETASNHIASEYLSEQALQSLTALYQIPQENSRPALIGVVMAGNIPLVGFHDFLCCFITGNRQMIKLSGKDQVLLPHLVKKMTEWNPEVAELVQFAPMLKGCDAYIATGSNNSSRYFEQYFAKYPNIIRKNRTSVAVLEGNETPEELQKLASDVHLYFGLGCRNVTKIYIPRGYDFVPLLDAFRNFIQLADHNKYKNNYDYQLAVLIINKLFYMTNGHIILKEDQQLFSPISQLNYEFYDNKNDVMASLQGNENIQCIVARDQVPFGRSQFPAVTDFADGVDTLKFLLSL